MFIVETFQSETVNTSIQARAFLWDRVKKPAIELPPTNDALLEHAKRARCQTFIWKTCISHRMVTVPGLEGNGYQIINGK